MTENTQPEADQTPEPSTGREAAKYRTRLRETEAQRDNLTAQVAALQQQAISRLLADSIDVPHPNGHNTTISVKLTHADDFERFTGLLLNDLTKDDGTIDTGKMNEAMTKLYTDRRDLFTGPPKTFIPGDAETAYSGPLKGSGFEAAFAPVK